ncbi:MAG: CotH kinase family protein [Gemmataceae bacterium]|nr:CotH kinase family protein [Gemmataceae bacterium]
MNLSKLIPWHLLLLAGLLAVPVLATQPPQGEKQDPDKKGFGKKGFPGGPGGFGGPFGQQRKLVKQFDKNGDGWLNKEERQAARAFIQKEGGGPGGFGPKGKGGFGGKGGPGGKVFFIGPGGFLAQPLLEALDSDKDGKISRAELIAGAKQLFTDSDKDKSGSLNETSLAARLNDIFPRPPGVPAPPPGKGPGGPGGFGPGNFFAGSIIRRADSDKDEKVTLKELVTAAEALFKEADKNKDGKLDQEELQAGIALVLPPPPGFGPGGGFGPPGGFGGKGREPGKPGPRVAPADVKTYPRAPLYEPTVLRTLFLGFENKDWEAELADFRNTDVEVPATLMVDGKKYPNVGIHFRGMSSYMMVPNGSRRSLGLSLDLANRKQRLYGYKTLNLLNSADDPSFLHTVLFAQVARNYIPAPKANLVKVVINGESWGVYVNSQQFNKDFVQENYKTTRGARWKVRGSPGAGAGLDYLGEDIEAYRRRYTIKSNDNEKDWKALVTLCRTLSKTPLDKLEEALGPMLDIEGVLWFLALDNATINGDGYWVRASDYNLYRDPRGKFHVIPHDINETFAPAGFGPGFGMGPKDGFGKGPKDGPGGKGPKGGPGGKGPKGGMGFGGGAGAYALDPLIGLDDARKPLRSRLLSVPSLRKRYLEHVRTLAEVWFDWNKLRPVVAQYRKLIEKEVELDTRKLYSLAEFRSALADEAPGGPGSRFSLRAFAEGRRNYLLNYPAIRELTPAGDGKKGGAR